MYAMDKVLRFWWGNEVSSMSSNRHKCYRSIIRNCGIKKIEMITPQNYKQYEVPEHPMHPAFPYLTEVHQSDYIRIYVTYFYGGGWTDVKYCDSNWNQYFELLDQHNDKEGIGCKILEFYDGKYQHLPTGHVHEPVLGMQQFIFKPKSLIFKDYLLAVESYLSEHLEDLRINPGTLHPYLCKDNMSNNWIPANLANYKYPLTWLGISEFFYNSQLKYLDKIMYGMPVPHNIYTGHDHR